jgi:hypothetical protein
MKEWKKNETWKEEGKIRETYFLLNNNNIIVKKLCLAFIRVYSKGLHKHRGELYAEIR